MTSIPSLSLEVVDRQELKDSPSELEDVTEDPFVWWIKLHNWFPRGPMFFSQL